MFKTLWFLILMAAVAWGAVLIADTPSSVTVKWLGYRVDTTIGVLFAAVLTLAVGVAAFWRLWSAVRTAPRKIGRARQDSRRRRGYKALTQGMVAVAAGDAIEARRQARRAERLLGEPPLTMLLSAQAAQLSGDDEAAHKFFEAMSERKETRYLGLRGQLSQAMQEGDSESAIELAEQAVELKPKTEGVTETLFDLQVKESKWSDAEATVRKSVKNKTIDADVGRRRRAVLTYGQSVAAEDEGKRDEALQLAKRANNLAPRFVPAAVRYARLLNGAGKRRRAASIIEETWVVNPHPELVTVMEGLSDSDNAQEKMRLLERLAGNNKDHPESHLALARAALNSGMYKEAREHLDAVAGDQPSARICRYMAELEEAEGVNPEAARDWLRRLSVADPDPAWVCDNCGNVVAEWDAVCGRCEQFDSLEWATPPRVTSYAADEEFHYGETLEPEAAPGEEPGEEPAGAPANEDKPTAN